MCDNWTAVNHVPALIRIYFFPIQYYYVYFTLIKVYHVNVPLLIWRFHFIIITAIATKIFFHFAIRKVFIDQFFVAFVSFLMST